MAHKYVVIAAMIAAVNFILLSQTNVPGETSSPAKQRTDEQVQIDNNLASTNPLFAGNALDLPAIPKQNSLSGIVTIPLPKILNAVTNASYQLFEDGEVADATIQRINGHWVAEWDTTAETNGPHFISLRGIYFFNGTEGDVMGRVSTVNISNALTFFNTYTRDFTDLLVIDPTVNVKADSYSIKVYDADTGAYFTNLAGAIRNGKIETSWNLLDGCGNRVVTNGLRCDFYLDPNPARNLSTNNSSYSNPISITYRFIEHIR